MLKLTRDFTMCDPMLQKAVGIASIILAGRDDWHGDLKEFLRDEVIPAYRHNKICFFSNFDRVPVGFVIWANLSNYTETRLLTTLDPWLHLSEWDEGESLWIRYLFLPKSAFRFGVKLCLDELFPKDENFRTMLLRKGDLSVIEVNRRAASKFSAIDFAWVV